MTYFRASFKNAVRVPLYGGAGYKSVRCLNLIRNYNGIQESLDTPEAEGYENIQNMNLVRNYNLLQDGHYGEAQWTLRSPKNS